MLMNKIIQSIAMMQYYLHYIQLQYNFVHVALFNTLYHFLKGVGVQKYMD